MAKRELIDRKQAVEVVSNGFDRWHMINLLASQESIPAITEQEIVKPYLEELKSKMKERDDDNGGEPLNAVDRGYHLACEHLCKEIDNLLSESEEKDDNNN